jgi:hypothetical protein
MWRRVCPGPAAPDTGFVYGTVIDAVTRRPVRGATIALNWFDVAVDSARRVRQKRWHATAASDSSGAYAICSIPSSVVPSVQATKDSASSGIVDLVRDDARLRRQDLVIGSAIGDRFRGTIVGTVTAVGGAPLSGARVVPLDVPEVKTDQSGRFVVRNVPAGTRSLEILAIGSVPTTLAVDVPPRDTVFLNVEVKRVTTLGVVNVIGSASQPRIARDIEDRKRLGFGKFVDSTALEGIHTMSTAMSGFPNVEIQRIGNANRFVALLPQGGSRCVANLFIDGVRQGGIQSDEEYFAILVDLHPEDIALIEAFVHGEKVPTEFHTTWSSCGAIVIWTKRRLRP